GASGANSSFVFNGILSGTNALLLTSANGLAGGTFVFGGTSANSLSGLVSVTGNNTALQLNKPGGVTAIAGPLTIGSGVIPVISADANVPSTVQLEANNQISANSALTITGASGSPAAGNIAAPGVLDLNGN